MTEYAWLIEIETSTGLILWFSGYTDCDDHVEKASFVPDANQAQRFESKNEALAVITYHGLGQHALVTEHGFG